MADITKDSFVESNNHQKIIFQRGKIIVDFELNEFQDILRTQQYRALVAQSGGLNPGSNDNGYLVVGTGASNSVTVKAGVIFCDGIPIVLLSDLTFSDLVTNTSGSTVINTIYLEVAEVEVADPAMVPQLGETTRRRKLTVDLHSVVGTSLPADSSQAVWEGGTRYFAIAQITRADTVDAINAADVVDVRKRLPALTVAQMMAQASISPAALTADQNNYNPPGISDAFMIRLTSTVDVNLTGIHMGQYGWKTVLNYGPKVITLKKESASSLAVNRFSAEVDKTIRPGEAVIIAYDSVAQRVHVIDRNDAAGASLLGLDNTWTGENFWTGAQTVFNVDNFAATATGYGMVLNGNVIDVAPITPVSSVVNIFHELLRVYGNVELSNVNVPTFNCLVKDTRFDWGIGITNNWSATEEVHYVDGATGAAQMRARTTMFAAAEGSFDTKWQISSAQSGYVDFDTARAGGSGWVKRIKLPQGAVLTRVRMFGAVSTSGSNATMTVVSKAPGIGVPIGSDTKASNTGNVTFDTGGISYTVDNTGYILLVSMVATSGSTAGSKDQLFYMLVDWLDPGPRND